MLIVEAQLHLRKWILPFAPTSRGGVSDETGPVDARGLNIIGVFVHKYRERRFVSCALGGSLHDFVLQGHASLWAMDVSCTMFPGSKPEKISGGLDFAGFTH